MGVHGTSLGRGASMEVRGLAIGNIFEFDVQICIIWCIWTAVESLVLAGD